jgi:hypothetical protein
VSKPSLTLNKQRMSLTTATLAFHKRHGIDEHAVH